METHLSYPTLAFFRARAHHAPREPALPDRTVRRLSRARRAAEPLPLAEPSSARSCGRGRRLGRRRDRHAPPARPGHRVQGPRPARRRRGAAVRGDTQRDDEAPRDRRRRPHAHREPHPAHARDGAHRDPRPVHDSDATRRPSADPHVRGGVRRAGRHRGTAPRAAARGPGVLRAQPRAGHRAGRARLRAMVPEARVVVAHGQMDEGTPRARRLDFWERRSDVLVCTTIIESGIDMPTVNTLVVDRADLLGLGQLHQLRGRVGRGGPARLRLPVPPARPGAVRAGLRAAADHRRAHRVGSGFKIAMRDLEIRGAGNLLGRTSPGTSRRSGYDLYVQLVARRWPRRGEPMRPRLDGLARRPRRRPPPDDYVRQRTTGSRPTAGWPGRLARPRSTTSGRSGPTGTGHSTGRPKGCSTWAACGPRRWHAVSTRWP